jgi:flagellar FliL protein
MMLALSFKPGEPMSETQAAVPPAAPPARGPSTLLLGLNALLLLGVLAVVVMMFLQQKKAPAAGAPAAMAAPAGDAKAEGGDGHEMAPAKTAPGAGPTVRFADFVIHLRNPEADRYARLSFEIEVAAEKDKDVVSAHQAQFRDAFIAYLSDRTVEELRGSNGLALVKAALIKEAQDLAPDGHIRSLYITDFVIQ